KINSKSSTNPKKQKKQLFSQYGERKNLKVLKWEVPKTTPSSEPPKEKVSEAKKPTTYKELSTSEKPEQSKSSTEEDRWEKSTPKCSLKINSKSSTNPKKQKKQLFSQYGERKNLKVLKWEVPKTTPSSEPPKEKVSEAKKPTTYKELSTSEKPEQSKSSTEEDRWEKSTPKCSLKKTASEADKPKKPTPIKKHAPAKETKPVKEKSTKPPPSTKAMKGKVLKVQKGKRYDRLIDEEDEEPQPPPEPQIEDDKHLVFQMLWGIVTRTNVDYDELLWEEFVQAIQIFFAYHANLNVPTKKTTPHELVGEVAIHEPTTGVIRSLPVVEGKGKAMLLMNRRTPMTKEASTRPSAQPKDDTSSKIVCDSLSPLDDKTGTEAGISGSEGDIEILNVGKEKGEDVSNTMELEERKVKLDEGQARSDPGNTLESRPSPDEDQAGSNPRQSYVALARPNSEPIHEDFIATIYPKVYESLKHNTEEHVFLEYPPSSSRTLLSMKNFDDAFIYGD
nr:hypothetical protein [Tanacetum cinerariifolium]